MSSFAYHSKANKVNQKMNKTHCELSVILIFRYCCELRFFLFANFSETTREVLIFLRISKTIFAAN